MSRDWTSEELRTVSEYMKQHGHMGYEEFVAELDRQKVVFSAIHNFSKVQRSGHFPCPRCGNYRMAKDPIRNALSRHVDIQICNSCGTDEAIRNFTNTNLPLTSWAIAEHPDYFLGDEQ